LKNILYIISILLLHNNLHSQSTKVEREFGTYLYRSQIHGIIDNNTDYILSGISIGMGAYQNNFRNSDGSNTSIFISKFNNQSGFTDGKYLVSEGGAEDGGRIAKDNEGNYYLTGVTSSTTITTNGAYDTNFGGGVYDGVIFKYDKDWNLIWATYFGGNQNDQISSHALDKDNNLIAVGYTFGSTADISNNGHSNTFAGNRDGILAKYDKDGNQLWASYYGGAGQDEIFGVDVDLDGNIYFCGWSRGSSGNTISDNGYQNLPNSASNFDAFLVKFDKNGNRLWGTYLGGNGNDQFVKVKVFGNKVYCIGYTTSTDVIGNDGFDNSYNGNEDGFIASFTTSGEFLWSSYLGQSDYDRLYALDIDQSGNLYVLGETSSTTSFATTNSYQENYGGGTYDIFIAKINNNIELEYLTYYGGSGSDDFSNVISEAFDVSDSGNISFAFKTTSSDGIVSANGNQQTLSSNYSALVKLKQKYLLSTSEVVGGSTTLDKTGYIKHGQPLNITFKAEQGYYLQTYSINSTTYSASNSVRIDAVRNPLTITPYFVIDPLGDIDDDGVNNQLELDSPNNGDSNNDGILDLYQANVTSIVDSSSNLKMSISTNLSKIYEVEHIKDIDDVHDYPYGLNAFKVNGNVTEISIIYYDLDLSKEYVYRKQKPDGSFYTLANAEYEILEINGVNALKITFEVIDGGAGDFDGIINGVIYDPGGLAILNINNNIPIWDWWKLVIIIPIFVIAYRKFINN